MAVSNGANKIESGRTQQDQVKGLYQIVSAQYGVFGCSRICEELDIVRLVKT